jgi:two-component system chemotaxis response regulator CheY
MRALIVDDSPVMRLIIGKIVRDYGFTVVEAANGQEALERLRLSDNPIDLALVDWNMPVIDGLEFVQAVRAGDAFAGLRLMMITTEVSAAHVRRAIEAGADEYLMKPFTRESLRDKLGLLGFEPTS